MVTVKKLGKMAPDTLASTTKVLSTATVNTPGQTETLLKALGRKTEFKTDLALSFGLMALNTEAILKTKK